MTDDRGMHEADLARWRRDRRRSLRMEPRPEAAKPNVKVADTVEEHEQAFRLLHEVYVEMGYMAPEASGIRVLPHHGLPETLVFLARDERVVLGTATLLFDGAFGLPMDELFREDLAPLRKAGRKLAEVSSLAVDSRFRLLLIDDEGHRRGLFWLLHQAVLYCAHRRGIDHLCITVNPRHARFYRSLYFFESFGEVKPYDKVRGAPAVAMHLDLRSLPEKLAEAVEESEKIYDLATFFYRMEHGFFQDRGHPGMPPEMARHFLVERTGLLHFLPAERADLLARLIGYPDRDHMIQSSPMPGPALCEASTPR